MSKKGCKKPSNKDLNKNNNSLNDNIISTQVITTNKKLVTFGNLDSNDINKNLSQNNHNIKESPQSELAIAKENIRKDARGYQIVKGNKKYKVTFKDLISKENLVNYIEIEDYKKYNITINSHISDTDNDDTSCTCGIF